MRHCLAFLACSTGLGAQVTVPRYVGLLDTGEARQIQYLHYAPEDRPLLWGSTGDLVISHLEQYRLGDVLGTTCEGTGIYRVAAGGGVTALTTGIPVCGGGKARFGIAADPQAHWIIYPRGGHLVRQALDTMHADTLSAACALNLQSPAVSSDGHRVAVIAMCHDGDRFGIFVLGTDGSHFHRVSPIDRNRDYVAPAWSPDGTRFAFDRDWRVGIMDMSGRAMHFIARGSDPAWSFDGQWIAYIALDHSIHIVHPNGSGDRVVFVNESQGTYDTGWGPGREGGVEWSLVWRPDGSALAFSRLFGAGTSIWRVDVATGVATALTKPQ